MGYAIVYGECLGCHRMFGFHPHLVPSCSAVTGHREPICQQCVDRVNPMRIAHGLEPIVPHPKAYEPCDDSEF
jgi:hypothetical protein